MESKHAPHSSTAPLQAKLFDYKQLAERQEETTLQPYAAKSKDHSRLSGREDDHRLPYKRDVDRIVHSKAFARYSDKTQVVYLVENDHITHRSLHVQLVSNFARGIAEILRLNLDLVEAIALGHDVGHPPFGHEGEEYLSELSKEFGNSSFAHSLQSCRLFSVIEPLNLGLAVYDGFLCHDGGLSGPSLHPQFGKTWQDHEREKKEKQENPEKNIMPGTLEGCLVKICDTMSYLGRDLEDAISLGIIRREQIPDTVLGKTNGEILSVLAKDLISCSYNQEFIAFSQESYQALREIRKFNFQHIYSHPRLKVESSKIKLSYRSLFLLLLEDLRENKDKSHIWTKFVWNKSESYRGSASPVQMVIDFISGMTDSFFIRTLEKIIIPKRIEL